MRKGGLSVGRGQGSVSQEEDLYDDFEIKEYNYSLFGLPTYDDDNCGEEYIDGPATQAVLYIQLYVFPILLLQGILGNLLTIPILFSISRSVWSTVIYLTLLSGVDLIILLVRCGDTWYVTAVEEQLSRQIMDSSDVVCRTYHFAFACLKHLSPWLFVAISIEMMIATRWPKRTYIMCTLERAKYTLMLMMLLIVFLDINYFWTYGVPKPGLGCRHLEMFSPCFRDDIWPFIDNIVEFLLPFACVSACFFLTAATMIRRSASQERDMETEMKRYFLELATLREFRIICLILCLIFMCLTAFKIVISLISFLLTRDFLTMDCLRSFFVKFRLYQTVVHTLTFLFESTKIYFYIALCPLFRTKLSQGFMMVCRKIGSCCRKTAICGQRWTPISLQDCGDCDRQNQNRPLVRDNTGNSLNKVGVFEERDASGAANLSSPSTNTQSAQDQQTGQSNIPRGTGNGQQDQGVKGKSPDYLVKDNIQGHRVESSEGKVKNNIEKHGIGDGLQIRGVNDVNVKQNANNSNSIPMNDIGTHV